MCARIIPCWPHFAMFFPSKQNSHKEFSIFSATYPVQQLMLPQIQNWAVILLVLSLFKLGRQGKDLREIALLLQEIYVELTQNFPLLICIR